MISVVTEPGGHVNVSSRCSTVVDVGENKNLCSTSCNMNR